MLDSILIRQLMRSGWDSLGSVRPLWDACLHWVSGTGLQDPVLDPCRLLSCMHETCWPPGSVKHPAKVRLDSCICTLCVPQVGKLSPQVLYSLSVTVHKLWCSAENLKGWYCSSPSWDLPSWEDAHYVSCILHNCSTGTADGRVCGSQHGLHETKSGHCFGKLSTMRMLHWPV